MKTRFLFVTLFAMLIAACNPVEVGVETPTTSAPSATPTAAPSAQPTPATPPIPADAQLFPLTEAGASLWIPADWQVFGPVQMKGYVLYTLGPDAGSSGGPGQSQIIVANEPFSIEEFAQAQCSTCPANPITDITVGGQPGKRTVIGGGGAPEAEWVFANHNGKLIGFSIRPVGDGLEWVLGSLAFRDSSSNTQTYRNDANGFELSIPSDWIVETTTPPAELVMLDTVAYIYSQPPTGGQSEGLVEGLKIDVIVIYDPSIAQSLDAALAWQKSGLGESEGQVVSEQRVLLPGNVPAVRLHTTSPRGEGVVLLTKVNDIVVLLGGNGTDLSRFDEVAYTLRAVEPGGVSGFVCSVAYVSESRVYCPGEGGTPVVVAEDTRGNISDVAVSSDGVWVAYIVNLPPEAATSELWATNVRGNAAHVRIVGPEQLLSPQPDTTSSPRNFEWLAGTHTLIFDTRFVPNGGIQGPGEYINNDLWRVEVETGAVRNLLPAQAGGNFYLSPDGQRIAVSGATSIQLMNADGSNSRTVVEYPMIITYSEYLYKPTLVWSTDSAFFSVLVPSPDPMAADTSATIFRVSADGNSGETIGRFDGNFVFGGPLGPGLSPDGQRLVYGQSNDQGVTNLILVGVDGSDPTIVASGSLSFNGWGWSPDSEWFVYGIVPEGGNHLLRRNGALQEFGEGLTIVGLEWVDATSFYFSAVSGNANYGLYLHRAGEATQELVSGLQPGLTFDVR